MKPKKNINLTISQDVIQQAKEIKLNLSQAAEKGIVIEIKKTLEAQWLEEHQDAIKAHNQRVAKEGVLLKPTWLNLENTEK